MKLVIPALVVYLIICMIVIFIPGSSAYNAISWKLFVGQIYAIPLFY